MNSFFGPIWLVLSLLVAEGMVLAYILLSVKNKTIMSFEISSWNSVLVLVGFLGILIGLDEAAYRMMETIKRNPNAEFKILFHSVYIFFGYIKPLIFTILVSILNIVLINGVKILIDRKKEHSESQAES